MKKSVLKIITLLLVSLSPIYMSGRDASPAPGIPSILYSLNFKLPANATEAIFMRMQLDQFGLSQSLFSLAMKGFDNLNRKGMLNPDSILTIVDFTKSSLEKRMVVIDLKNEEVLFHTTVAHGQRSGTVYARSFSNQPSSHKSSIGFYVTMQPYNGSNGYSLKLNGFDRGFNDKAYSRAIVIHGADYVKTDPGSKVKYQGRSYGCPAVPAEIHKEIINKIKNGNCLFIYYPDRNYLKKSKLLNG